MQLNVFELKRANYVARAVVMLKSLRSVALLRTICFALILIFDLETFGRFNPH